MSSSKGFTLIELTISMGIVSGLIFSIYTVYQNQEKIIKEIEQMTQINDEVSNLRELLKDNKVCMKYITENKIKFDTEIGRNNDSSIDIQRKVLPLKLIFKLRKNAGGRKEITKTIRIKTILKNKEIIDCSTDRVNKGNFTVITAKDYPHLKGVSAEMACQLIGMKCAWVESISLTKKTEDSSCLMDSDYPHVGFDAKDCKSDIGINSISHDIEASPGQTTTRSIETNCSQGPFVGEGGARSQTCRSKKYMPVTYPPVKKRSYTCQFHNSAFCLN